MKQLEFEKVSGHGGKRRGAGRKNRSGLMSHGKRPPVDFKKPLHITLKLKRKMPNLRTREFHKQFRHAAKQAKRLGFNLTHYSLQTDHVHLIAEARDNRSLETGMKSLAGRLGRRLRSLVGGQGSVWAGRFHLRVLKTPTEVKRVLQYVLLNRAKHANLIEHLDEFSSAFAFTEWKKLIGKKWNGLLQEQVHHLTESEKLSRPTSWLLRVGWTRATS